MHHSRTLRIFMTWSRMLVISRSRLVHGFFHPGEERSDSVRVEQEQNWIVRGDLEFFEGTIPDSKYLDSCTVFCCRGPAAHEKLKSFLEYTTLSNLHGQKWQPAKQARQANQPNKPNDDRSVGWFFLLKVDHHRWEVLVPY